MVDMPTEAYTQVVFTSRRSVDESDVGRVGYPCLMGYRLNCNKTFPDASTLCIK